MSKTTNIYVRVEPEIKEQAESILEQLGLPMSSAINIFLRQVVMQNGLPFDVKLAPLSFNDLSDAEFDTEIQKGYDDYANGRVISAAAVREKIRSNNLA